MQNLRMMKMKNGMKTRTDNVCCIGIWLMGLTFNGENRLSCLLITSPNKKGMWTEKHNFMTMYHVYDKIHCCCWSQKYQNLQTHTITLYNNPDIGWYDRYFTKRCHWLYFFLAWVLLHLLSVFKLWWLCT